MIQKLMEGPDRNKSIRGQATLHELYNMKLLHHKKYKK